jgi:hypothetical protein
MNQIKQPKRSRMSRTDIGDTFYFTKLSVNLKMLYEQCFDYKIAMWLEFTHAAEQERLEKPEIFFYTAFR